MLAAVLILMFVGGIAGIYMHLMGIEGARQFGSAQTTIVVYFILILISIVGFVYLYSNRIRPTENNTSSKRFFQYAAILIIGLILLYGNYLKNKSSSIEGIGFHLLASLVIAGALITYIIHSRVLSKAKNK